MKLNKNQVIEFKLNDENFITGYQIWNRKRRIDLIDEVEPPDEMVKEGLFDQFNRPIWRHVGDAIVKQILPDPSPVLVAKDYINNLSRYEMLKLICKGIQNKNDDDFVDFMDKVNLL